MYTFKKEMLMKSVFRAENLAMFADMLLDFITNPTLI